MSRAPAALSSAVSRSCPPSLSGTVVVTYGDVPLLDGGTLGRLVAAHTVSAAAVTVLTAHVADPTGYGRVVRDGSDAVVGIVEHKDADEAQRADHRDQLRDLRLRLGGAPSTRSAGSAPTTPRARSTSPTCCRWRARDGLLVAAVADRRRVAGRRGQRPRPARRARPRAQPPRARGLDARGVTVVDPAHDVGRRHRDPRAGHRHCCPARCCTARPRSRREAVVGPDTTLTDCVVGEGATVVRSHATCARIGAGASVGPFS